MTNDDENRQGWMWATVTVREILGLTCLMAGWWRCFGDQMSPKQHAVTFFIMPYGEGKTWIPEWLLWGLGVSLPILELCVGALICLGLARRAAYAALAAILVIVTYGKLLMEPTFEITGHIFPRLVLLVFLWLAPPGRDVLALDTLADRFRATRRGGTSPPHSEPRD